ncbi:retrovirus-related pol polyprotein from transposon TNT 1-94 [Tanacetum coccineum]
MESSDPVDTPMVEKSKLDEDTQGKAIDPTHYRGMIVTLMYLTATHFDSNIKQPSPVSPSTPTPQSSDSPIRPTSHTNSPSSQPVTSISRPTSQTSLLRSRPNSIHIRSPTVARATNPSRPLHISQTTQTPRPPTTLIRTIHTRSMSGITKLKTPFNFSASTSLSPIPHNPNDALSDMHWNHAMTDEFNALIDNKTWFLVPCTPDMHVIQSMWIFRHKMKSDGSFERY